uniref:MATH domain-containing protein n=1 Tax=Steinernema glaseri TaxID=37863 RepID=A0A1I8A2S1_9BILA
MPFQSRPSRPLTGIFRASEKTWRRSSTKWSFVFTGSTADYGEACIHGFVLYESVDVLKYLMFERAEDVTITVPFAIISM